MDDKNIQYGPLRKIFRKEAAYVLLAEISKVMFLYLMDQIFLLSAVVMHPIVRPANCTQKYFKIVVFNVTPKLEAPPSANLLHLFNPDCPLSSAIRHP
ncbi:hypothetical protein ACTXT7_004348 [Hymenolepis weldensis]